MFRFLYVIIMNLFRAPYLIPMMRRYAADKEKYSLEERYTLAQKVVNYMRISGRVSTEVYGKENLHFIRLRLQR